MGASYLTGIKTCQIYEEYPDYTLSNNFFHFYVVRPSRTIPLTIHARKTYSTVHSSK